MTKENELCPEEDKSIIETAAKRVLNSLRKGKRLYDMFSIEFGEKYLINGQLPEHWKDYFHLQIPQDATPPQLRDLNTQLSDLFQEANFHKIICDAKLKSLKGSSNTNFRESFVRLVAEYKTTGNKLPSKDTLEHLAMNEQDNLPDAITHSELELSFWKGILDNLENYRDTLKSISISLAIEQKNDPFTP
jgi:hypothetical protein